MNSRASSKHFIEVSVEAITIVQKSVMKAFIFCKFTYSKYRIQRGVGENGRRVCEWLARSTDPLPFIRGERPDGPYFVLSEALQDADSLFAIPAGLFDVLPNSLVTTSQNTVSMNL